MKVRKSVKMDVEVRRISKDRSKFNHKNIIKGISKFKLKTMN